MQEIIIIGDRVLIEPEHGEKQTQSGLYLPATVTDRERVSIGRVVRTGPGYVIPNPEFSESETWAPSREAARYLPLQARAGDLAFFLRKEMIEVALNGKDYVIVPHNAILALIRDGADDVLDGIKNLNNLDDLIR
jgi:co-chaperonin GroES (HSP10)